MKPFHVVMDDENMERIMQTLKSKVKEMMSSNELKVDRLTHPGLALLSSPHHWKAHFADIKIYLESCVALDHGIDDQPDAFLVTDDNKIFSFLFTIQCHF